MGFCDKLFDINDRLEAVPQLATGYRWEDPTTLLISLRQGVRFHEGQAFNADDVVFSVHRALQRTSNYGIFVDTVTRAERVNAFTVDIVTRVPDPILPNKLASLMIMSRDWAEQHNAIRPQNTAQREEMHTVRATNGTGAYRLSVREPDVRTVMVRHDAWYGWQEENPGNITEIDFRPIRSDATRIAALLSGEVDFVLDPPLQDLARLRANQNVRVIEGPEVRTIFFAFDTARPTPSAQLKIANRRAPPVP
jgi:peptide/nickel transport system substrate-binding protein